MVSFFLDTAQPPEFVTCFPSSLAKHVDNHLELSCTVNGSPHPVISWFYNDNPLDRSSPRIKFLDGDRRLMIRRLRLVDTGIYSCLIKNECGEKIRSCELNVASKF